MVLRIEVASANLKLPPNCHTRSLIPVIPTPDLPVAIRSKTSFEIPRPLSVMVTSAILDKNISILSHRMPVNICQSFLNDAELNDAEDVCEEPGSLASDHRTQLPVAELTVVTPNIKILTDSAI